MDCSVEKIAPQDGSKHSTKTKMSNGNAKICDSCGSGNVHETGFGRPAFNLIRFFLFDIYYMIFRTAFAKVTVICRDCGATKKITKKSAYAARLVLGGLITLLIVWILLHLAIQE